MLNILLVDDDADSLRGLTLALGILKHRCETFTDPLEAWGKFKTSLYDVVITDICMPGINGFELGNKIRQWQPDAKIIYISGQLSDPEETPKEQNKTSIFLRKPINFFQLKEAISQSDGLERGTQSGVF